MKVIANTTTANLRDGKLVYSPPGEIDLPEADAKDLVARGLAKLPAVAAEEAKAGADGPKVTKSPPAKAGK